MKCFRHNHVDAIGVCRHCCRGVCDECTDQYGSEIVCGPDCARERDQAYQLSRRLRESFGVGRKPPMPASISTYFFFGVILLLMGLYFWLFRQDFDVLTFALAGVFFVMSGTTYRRYRDSCMTCR